MVKHTKAPVIGFHWLIIVTIVIPITTPLGYSMVIITVFFPFKVMLLVIIAIPIGPIEYYWLPFPVILLKMRCRMTSKDHPLISGEHWAEHLRRPTLKYQF